MFVLTETFFFSVTYNKINEKAKKMKKDVKKTMLISSQQL
jgi:hypothetical protein